MPGSSASGVFGAALVTGLLMLMLVMVLQRHLFVAVSRAQQVLAVVAAGLLVYPSYLTRIVGTFLALAIMLANRIQPSRIH